MGTTQPIRNKKTLENFRNYYKKEENKPRNYALIVFGLNSALRISDILNLKWKDVCNSAGYLEHIIVTEKKNRKEKCVGIEPCNKGSTGLLSKNNRNH